MLRFTKKDTPEFAELLFVAHAVSKDECKFTLMHILKTEDGDLVATDGHRCHVYRENIILVSGLYEVAKRTKNELILNLINSDNFPDFPDYKRVIPEKSEVTELSNSNDYKIATILRSMKNNCLNLGYLAQALSVEMITVCKSDGISPVRMDGENVTAVIMPKKG